jgi:hypothetical protein
MQPFTAYPKNRKTRTGLNSIPYQEVQHMSGKRPSVYLTEGSLKFLENRADSLSGAINQTVDRYDQTLKQIDLPKFSDAEINALLSATQGVLYQPAEMIAGLWQGIADGLIDDLTEKIDADDKKLIEKLKKLTFPQEVALLERLEQRRRKKEKS